MEANNTYRDNTEKYLGYLLFGCMAAVIILAVFAGLPY